MTAVAWLRFLDMIGERPLAECCGRSAAKGPPTALGRCRPPRTTADRHPILVALELRNCPGVTGCFRCTAVAQIRGSDDCNGPHCCPSWRVCQRQQWVGNCRPWTSAIRTLNLGVSFPAVRSLTLLSLADPLLSVASTSWMSVASTSWMSAVQRKESLGKLGPTHADRHEAVIRLANRPELNGGDRRYSGRRTRPTVPACRRGPLPCRLNWRNRPVAGSGSARRNRPRTWP